ncbi:MAG: SGNH/GDSL hydrolase family protein [Candidatus Micrarchaeota archaeon]
MATVTLDENGHIIITFADRTTFSSKEKITKEMSEATAMAAITRAMNGAYGKYKEESKLDELDAIGGKTRAIAKGLLKKLNEIVSVKVEPPKPVVEKRPEPRVVVPPPRVVVRPPAKKIEPPPVRVEAPKPVRRAPPPRRVESPRVRKPTIDRRIILAQIGTKDQAKAATFLISNGEKIDRYLQVGQSGIERTRTQREATIRVFNELDRIPNFRLYLSSVANPETNLEFAMLEGFLGQHKAEDLRTIDNREESRILSYADLYIRYYLANYAIKDPRFKKELEQLERFGKLGKDDLRGAIDSDTIAAAELHIRRWMQHKNLKSDLAAWEPPREEQIPEVTQQQRIAIIGSSMVGDSRKHPSKLGQTLQNFMADTIVDSYGIRGETLHEVATRFKELIDGGVKYDRIIISAQAFANNPNYIFSRAALETMIKQAKIPVIVTGVMPYGEHRSCTSNAWRNAEELNSWLEANAAKGEITYVNLRSLGDDSNPPRLRPEFTSEGSDGLHSTLAREETARLIAEKLGVTVPPSIRREEPARVDERRVPDREPPRVEATPLQIFAKEYWTELRQQLAQAVEQKNPAKIIRLTKIDLPPGQQLENALTTLGRNDVQLAFRDVFKSLNDDEEFKTFVKAKRYTLVKGRNLIELPEGTGKRDLLTVILASRAVQEYMKAKADVNADFGGDVRKLQEKIGRQLSVTPSDLILTLSVIAVYRWRMQNTHKDIGEWGKEVGIKPEPTRKQTLF